MSDLDFSKRPYLPTARAQCTFFKCAKGLLEKQKSVEQPLTKKEKDHILRTHSLTPVKIACEKTGMTIVFSRNPKQGMRFQCCCGSLMLGRDSVHRHYPCPKVTSVVEPTEYYRMLNPNQELADAQNESESDVEEVIEVAEGAIVPWKEQNPPHHNDIVATDITRMFMSNNLVNQERHIQIQNQMLAQQQMAQHQNEMFRQQLQSLQQHISTQQSLNQELLKKWQEEQSERVDREIKDKIGMRNADLEQQMIMREVEVDDRLCRIEQQYQRVEKQLQMKEQEQVQLRELKQRVPNQGTTVADPEPSNLSLH